MGCFDRTCCISNTSISYKEDCVFVVFPKEFLDINKNAFTERDFYRLMQRFWEMSSFIKNYKTPDKDSNIENIDLYESIFGKGKVDSYIKSINSIKILSGLYNDYGIIENLDKEIDECLDDSNVRENTWIFHKWAFESVVGKSYENFVKSETPILTLVDNLFYLRINPMALGLFGQQSKDIQEMRKQLLVVTKTKEYLENKIQKYLDDGYEDNMEDEDLFNY